jgi:hypothetical protein
VLERKLGPVVKIQTSGSPIGVDLVSRNCNIWR